MPRPNTSGFVGVKKHGERWRAYDGNAYFGCYDTPLEAAAARARAMGLPPPVVPEPAAPAPRPVDAQAVAVSTWWHSLWRRYDQTWQAGMWVSIAALHQSFRRATSVPENGLSVRRFSKLVRKVVQLEAQSRRFDDGVTTRSWFITPQAACPPSLLEGWHALKRQVEQRESDRIQLIRQRQEEVLQAARQRQRLEDERDAIAQLKRDNAIVKVWLRKQGIAETESNCEKYRYKSLEMTHSDSDGGESDEG